MFANSTINIELYLPTPLFIFSGAWWNNLDTTLNLSTFQQMNFPLRLLRIIPWPLRQHPKKWNILKMYANKKFLWSQINFKDFYTFIGLWWRLAKSFNLKKTPRIGKTIIVCSWHWKYFSRHSWKRSQWSLQTFSQHKISTLQPYHTYFPSFTFTLRRFKIEQILLEILSIVSHIFIQVMFTNKKSTCAC